MVSDGASLPASSRSPIHVDFANNEMMKIDIFSSELNGTFVRDA